VHVRPPLALGTQFGDVAERSPPAVASGEALELRGIAYTLATTPSVEGDTNVRCRRRALDDAGCAGTTNVAVTAVCVTNDDGVADGCGTRTGATDGPLEDEHATVTGTDSNTNIIAKEKRRIKIDSPKATSTASLTFIDVASPCPQ
jgi:hypothetical protein